jgi:hypothetical protein
MEPALVASSTGCLDNLLASLEPFGNWELRSAMDKEKTRLRGVMESLGPAGWAPFVQSLKVEHNPACLNMFLLGGSLRCPEF